MSEVLRMTNGRLAAFVLPNIPLAAFLLPASVHLPPFYAEELGLGIAVVGQIFLAARAWDVIVNITFGIISDRTQTPWGRQFLDERAAKKTGALTHPDLEVCLGKHFQRFHGRMEVGASQVGRKVPLDPR